MNKQKELETWLSSIVKKASSSNRVIKEQTIDITDCAYCTEQEPLFQMPFAYDNVRIESNKLYCACFCGREVDISIHFCPMCGREL